MLAATYPDAGCELDFATPFQLLVATVLSAQTTDKRVNAVTPALFAAYPDAPALAGADRDDVERIIQPTGFFRAKTESLLSCPGARRAVRRRGPRAARGPRHPAGRRSQDRQRRARQRLRDPRDHRRHPLRPALAPLRVDRGDRPGQGRARGRRAVPQAGLDAAQPPPDLARPAGCHARNPACGACPVARWCPAYGEGPTDPEVAAAGEDRGSRVMASAGPVSAPRRRAHLSGAQARRRRGHAAGRGRDGRSRPLEPGGRRHPRAADAQGAGRGRPLPRRFDAYGPPGATELPVPLLPCLGGGPDRCWRGRGPRGHQPLGAVVRAVRRGAAALPAAPRAGRRPRAGAGHRLAGQPGAGACAGAGTDSGVTYPLVADPAALDGRPAWGVDGLPVTVFVDAPRGGHVRQPRLRLRRGAGRARARTHRRRPGGWVGSARVRRRQLPLIGRSPADRDGGG